MKTKNRRKSPRDIFRYADPNREVRIYRKKEIQNCIKFMKSLIHQNEEYEIILRDVFMIIHERDIDAFMAGLMAPRDELELMFFQTYLRVIQLGDNRIYRQFFGILGKTTIAKKGQTVVPFWSLP